MQLWHAILGLLLVVPLGIVIGLLYCYFHFRLFYKVRIGLKTMLLIVFRYFIPIKKVTTFADRHLYGGKIGTQDNETAIQKPSEEEITFSPDRERPQVHKQEETEPLLFIELRNNLRIIQNSTPENLNLLDTECWSTGHREHGKLSTKRYAEIQDIYTDIMLLNNIVWMANEFHRSSQSITDQYNNLSAIIKEKIEGVLSIGLNATH